MCIWLQQMKFNLMAYHPVFNQDWKPGFELNVNQLKFIVITLKTFDAYQVGLNYSNDKTWLSQQLHD